VWWCPLIVFGGGVEKYVEKTCDQGAQLPGVDDDVLVNVVLLGKPYIYERASLGLSVGLSAVQEAVTTANSLAFGCSASQAAIVEFTSSIDMNAVPSPGPPPIIQ